MDSPGSARPLSFRMMERERYRVTDLKDLDHESVNPPDPMLDYRESSLAEILSMDLTSATLILEPSYFCNLRCTFCALPVWSRTLVDWTRLSAVCQALALCGLRSVTLTGGEPGIVANIAGILEDLRRWGMRTTLLTHGLWAYNEDYLARILANGNIDGILMSVKAFDAVTFGALTGRTSLFEKQAGALANIARAYRDGRLRRWTVNHVMTRQTIDRLPDLSWLDGLEAQPEIVFSLMEPYLPEMAGSVPSAKALRKTLPSLLACLEARGIQYSFEGLPICILGESWRRSCDIDRRCDDAYRIVVQPRQEADYVLVFQGYQRLLQFIKLPTCSGCRLASSCPGVHMRMAPAWVADGLLHAPDIFPDNARNGVINIHDYSNKVEL